jgi:hypothetical protein
VKGGMRMIEQSLKVPGGAVGGLVAGRAGEMMGLRTARGMRFSVRHRVVVFSSRS